VPKNTIPGIAPPKADHYPDERTEAIDHLDFAIDQFREMKMAPSVGRAEALEARAT